MIKNILAKTLKKRATLLMLIALVAVTSTPALSVRAQDTTQPSSINIEVSPLFFELTGSPGDKITKTMRVFNGSETDTQTYTLSLLPFKGTETGQAFITETEDPAYSLKNWVAFSVNEFTLKPKEAREFNFTLSIPKDAEPGGRYGSVVVSTTVKKLNPEEGTGASTVQKVGSLILLTIPGNITYRAYIKDFLTDKSWYPKVPVGFKLRIRNESTVHIQPTGIIEITNMFHRKVGVVDVPSRIILPSSDRFLEMSFDGRIRLPGIYTAMAGLNYGEGSGAGTMTKTISFIFLPWWFIIAAIAFILLVIIIIKKRRQIREALRVLFGKSNK